MNRKTNIILSSILVIAWMMVIFIFSATPADESNSESMNIVNKVVQKFEAKSSMEIKEHTRQQAKVNSTNGQAQVKIASASNEERNLIGETQTNDTNQLINKTTTEQNNKEKTKKVSKATLLKLNKLIRKFAHASVYFILYILVLNLIYQIKGEYKFAYCMVSIAVCFIYACTDEFHQLFVEGRSGLFSDVIIDTIGATISYIIVEIIHRIRLKIQKRNKSNKKLTKKDTKC